MTSGKDAIARVSERYERDDNYFDIIIDWKIPEMDGIETTRRIHKIVGNNVTIIIQSAYDYMESEQEARQAGVDEFIVKSLFRSQLTAALKNIIEGKPTTVAKHYLSYISKCDYSGKRILLVEDNDPNREIAEEIISMTGAKNIPVMDMTANTFTEDVFLAKNAGMNEHISKPLDMTRLRDVLNRWL